MYGIEHRGPRYLVGHCFLGILVFVAEISISTNKLSKVDCSSPCDWALCSLLKIWIQLKVEGEDSLSVWLLGPNTGLFLFLTEIFCFLLTFELRLNYGISFFWDIDCRWHVVLLTAQPPWLLELIFHNRLHMRERSGCSVSLKKLNWYHEDTH